MTVQEIKDICGADVTGRNAVVNEFMFDSRSLSKPEGTLFCAITTEAADGHQFIAELYAKGVKLFMVERTPEWAGRCADATFIKVENVFKAVETLGAAARQALGCPVVGITGSQGKTVVKEILYRALGDGTWRSPRSWNSRLGVPVSLLEAPADAKVAIVECGIDRKGDMAEIEKIVKPNIGVLTSITEEHDHGFPTHEVKILEKLKLFKDSDVLIYDAGDPEVDTIVRNSFPADKLRPVKADGFEAIDKAIVKAVLNELGADNVEVENIAPVANRLDVHEGVNDCVMLYDGFTHDLRSLKAALDFMRRRTTSTRTSTLIISDLIHEKDNEPETYEQLAETAKAFGINRIIAIGAELKRHSDLFGPSIKVENIDSTADFLNNYDINRFSSETILIAGEPADEFLQIKAVLENARHDTIYEINLDALIHNFNYYRSLLKPTTGLVGMVKASAYGMGALEVSKTLQAQGAVYLAVAVIDEGVELRRGGITMPIMVLNPITTNYKALFDNKLEPSVFSLRELHTLVNEARKAGIKEFKAHIKLDTGMHRVGFSESEIPALIETLQQTKELHVASVFSHLATADCPDEGDYTQMQLDLYEKLSSRICKATPYPVLRHILNTAGIMTHPEYQYDMVRLGIGLYGVSPLEADQGDLRPVATLKSTIISIKSWPAGTTVGYGRRGLLKRDSVIATVPIGYADGVDRHLSRGNASFIVRGTECPTVGNICMDQCMIDITDVPDAKIGDDVEIFGNRQRVEHLAEILETIPYELISTVSPRVKRIYFRD